MMRIMMRWRPLSSKELRKEQARTMKTLLKRTLSTIKESRERIQNSQTLPNMKIVMTTNKLSKLWISTLILTLKQTLSKNK